MPRSRQTLAANRVVAAMSGGVDSSVAAALLRKKGREVIGLTMCFGLKDLNKRRPACCGIEGVEDSRKVAHKLGIRHYVLNFDKQLQEKVIGNFLSEYASGRTPNPCIRCNEFLKFQDLLEKAKSLGAQFLATGHYARISQCGQEYCLMKAKDKYKDQSYFLYRLRQKQLNHILFPLGNITKEKVRRMAFDLGLGVAEKPASQEICFVPDDDYRGFIRRYFKEGVHSVQPGQIIDVSGKILGRHKGIPYYTVGQREGLGLALGYPAYVIRINPQDNSITVGTREQAMSYGLLADDLSYISKPLKDEVVLEAKIRYNHSGVSARVIPYNDKILLVFKDPQFAVSPGQSVVLYQNQKVFGGGIIQRGLSRQEVWKKCKD